MTPPNTPRKDEVREIADGLTRAQREALLSAQPDRWMNSKEIGATGATLSSLCWHWPKGADPISPCISFFSRDYEDRPLRYCYRLSTFGLEIRAYLKESGNANQA